MADVIETQQGSSSDSCANAGTPPSVLIVCDYFPPSVRAGGPSRSIWSIVKSQTSYTRNLTILTRDHDIGSSDPYPPSELKSIDEQLEVVSITRIPRRRQYSKLFRQLRTASTEHDMIYLNSVMSPVYSLWPLALMTARLIPRRRILIAPRGELSRGALAIKPKKKRTALPFIRLITRTLDCVWHASSPHEAADIRRFLGDQDQPVVIQANPAPPAAKGADEYRPSSEVVALFVARMAPVKNFALVAQAMAQIDFPLRLIVAGSLEDQQYWGHCKRLLESASPHVVTEILGHQSDAEVSTLFSRSDVLVMPTRGENFGRSIAEALASGCPAMVADTTLWTPILRAGAGWIIDTDDPSVLADALRSYSSLSRKQRLDKRQKVLDNYNAWWLRTQVGTVPLFGLAMSTDSLPGADRSRSRDNPSCEDSGE